MYGYKCTLMFVVVYISLMPFAQSTFVPGYTEQYDMEKYCNGPTIVVNYAAILTLNSGDLTPSIRQCNVTIESRWLTTDSRLRLEIVALNVPCLHQESLQIFNGAAGNPSRVSISYPDRICTDGSRNYQAMYLNNGNTVSLAIRVNGTQEAEITMKLLATATAYLPEPKISDFRCDNNLRIVQDLTCDGNNNCGDRSDETEKLCYTTKETQRSSLLVSTIVLASVLVVGVVGVVIYCRRGIKTPGENYNEFHNPPEPKQDGPNPPQSTEAGRQSGAQNYGELHNPPEPKQDGPNPPQSTETSQFNVANPSFEPTSNSVAMEATVPKTPLPGASNAMRDHC